MIKICGECDNTNENAEMCDTCRYIFECQVRKKEADKRIVEHYIKYPITPIDMEEFRPKTEFKEFVKEHDMTPMKFVKLFNKIIK
jgi:hypothetical protein